VTARATIGSHCLAAAMSSVEQVGLLPMDELGEVTQRHQPWRPVADAAA
jgi:hypothetical protein